VNIDEAPQQSPMALPPGEHIIDVRYSKPADTEGRLRLWVQGASGTERDWRLGEVTPGAESPWRRSIAAPLVYLASSISVIVVVLAALGLAPAVVAKVRSSRSLHPYVAPAVLLALTAQGLWKARHLVDHVWTLTGGDDWLAFQMNARSILLNGWMMTRGIKGAPYYEYPGYGYFVALVHMITGESLAGVVLANFIALALATITVYALARLLFSARAAYVAVALLLLIEQLAFVRYYTVTLLSENLFFPLAAATVYCVVRFATGGQAGWIAAGGIAGGLAAVTRPTMMAYLPCALLLAMAARVRLDGVARTARNVLLYAALWMMAISPFTLRNYIVSGSPVLITDGAAVTFVRYNVPPGNADAERKYLLHFRGGNFAAAVTLAQILWEYPRETLRGWGIKIGFALGMVHWLDLRPHPELIATSALYLLAIVLLKGSRTVPALLVHAFIATHLATLLLTVPWNYGYRMLLTMYLFMPIFGGALVAAGLERWAVRGSSPEGAAS
jgi:4-amino-4-deoxy-L-arabinose transferase-like glycosyltransferase